MYEGGGVAGGGVELPASGGHVVWYGIGYDDDELKKSVRDLFLIA